MTITRSQISKQMEPGLNALFGLIYNRYEQQHLEIFDEESSERAFEEDVMQAGFSTAPIKSEGSAITFDSAQETYTARYIMETTALAFSLTEEAVEDNLYVRLASTYTKALARAMAQSKQIKGASILNNAYQTGRHAIGDGAALCSAAHPTLSGNQSNVLTTSSDLNETSLEEMLIGIAGLVDERGLKIALNGRKLIIPKELQFVAERVLNSNLRPSTADNDINAMKSMGVLPEGAVVNHFLTDTDAFFIKTDAPNGFKYFNRISMQTKMEGDFDTGNMRYKARERYAFGVSDWRAVYGSPGV